MRNVKERFLTVHFIPSMLYFVNNFTAVRLYQAVLSVYWNGDGIFLSRMLRRCFQAVSKKWTGSLLSMGCRGSIDRNALLEISWATIYYENGYS